MTHTNVQTFLCEKKRKKADFFLSLSVGLFSENYDAVYSFPFFFASTLIAPLAHENQPQKRKHKPYAPYTHYTLSHTILLYSLLPLVD